MGYEIPMLNSCCCGCTLRTGSKIIGWLYLIGGIMITCMFMGIAYFEETHNTPQTIAIFFIFIEVILNIVQTVASFLLLLGAYQSKKKLVWYWVLGNTTAVFINIIISLVYIFLESLIFSAPNIAFMVLELYSCLVGYSYYRDMTDSSTFSV